MKDFPIQLQIIDVTGGIIILNPIGKNIFEANKDFWNLATRLLKERIITGTSSVTHKELEMLRVGL